MESDGPRRLPRRAPGATVPSLAAAAAARHSVWAAAEAEAQLAGQCRNDRVTVQPRTAGDFLQTSFICIYRRSRLDTVGRTGTMALGTNPKKSQTSVPELGFFKLC